MTKRDAAAGATPTIASVGDCKTCVADRAFLRTTTRPDYEEAETKLRIVDLFAGGGGLTIGAAEAARRVGLGTTVVLAVEHDESVADVYELNFPEANLDRSDVSCIFEGALGSTPTKKERNLVQQLGKVDLLMAGPPCQGHSDLNNHTRRKDPRNALYLRAVLADPHAWAGDEPGLILAAAAERAAALPGAGLASLPAGLSRGFEAAQLTSDGSGNAEVLEDPVGP